MKKTDQTLLGILISGDDGYMAKKKYPSACLVLESCIQDYQRVQGNYDQIYEKINIALAFTGVVLTLMLNFLDFSAVNVWLCESTVMEVILIAIELTSQLAGLLLIGISTVHFLLLMKGREVPVFDSIDIRNKEIYCNKESAAAVWLIGQYTAALAELRPIVRRKQDAFDRGITITVIGIISYSVAMLLMKAGY